MKQEEIEKLFEQIDVLYAEAARVANILKEHKDSCKYRYEIDADDIRYEQYSGLYADLEWANCSRGCCGSSEYQLWIPTSYLFNSDLTEEIEKEVAAKKKKEEEAQKKSEAAQRAAEIRAKKIEYERLKKEFGE